MPRPKKPDFEPGFKDYRDRLLVLSAVHATQDYLTQLYDTGPQPPSHEAGAVLGGAFLTGYLAAMGITHPDPQFRQFKREIIHHLFKREKENATDDDPGNDYPH